MKYYIDGYNFLFRVFHSEKKLEKQRDLALDFLEENCSHLNLSLSIVFDAHNQSRDTPTESDKNHLTIIYTPSNQTADEFLIERAALSKNPSQITVITSDRGLTNKLKALTSKVQSIDDFLIWISKKEKKQSDIKNESSDTKKNIERLLKIFEKNLKEDLDDWH